jgi:Carboxypeptidase regulatory-like domain
VERIERLRRQLLHGSSGPLSSFAVLVVIAGLSLSLAQEALASEPDTIEGVVTSAVSTAPIQGVEVCTGRYIGQQSCVSTKANGTYTVPAPPVSLPVEFNAPAGSGFVSHTYYKGVYLLSEAAELTVPVGGTLSGIDAELQPEGRIEGVVTNASTKAPVDGVEVCASPLAAWPEVLTCENTNFSGVYEIPGLAPVQYKVKFDPAGLNYLPETPQLEYTQYPTITAGKTTANVDVALTEGAQIEGQVKSAASGLALTGEQVCASGFGPSLATKCANTDPQGHYVINGLETSSYHVFFSDQRPYVGQSYDEGRTVRLTQGETLAGVNASLLTGTTISGVVTSASTGEPMNEVEACVDERVGEEVSGYCTEPNEAGEYALTGIPTSTDMVEFRPRSNIYEYETQYWNHVGVSTEATELHTTTGEAITGIDAALTARYGAISGRVLSAPGGERISLAEVCATNMNGGRTRCAETNLKGEYEIAFLPGGSYIVKFSTPHQRPGYRSQFYDDKSSEGEAVGVAVGAGTTTQSIDAELVPEPVVEEREGTGTGSRIGGIVSSRSDLQPIAGAEVCAYDSAEDEVEEGLFGQCATTGTNGEYSLTGLAGGEYLVEFYSPPAGGLDYVTQYYDDVESFEQATLVRVGPETDDLGVNAQMREGGRISGRVTGASTAVPLADVLVCALTPSEAVDCAVTGENGEYAMAGVPVGSYAVGFEAGEEYEVQYYENETSFSAAKQVTVKAGGSTSGIDAAMQAAGRAAPPPVKSPPQQAGGNPAPGGTVATPKAGVAASATTVLPASPAVAAGTSRVVISGKGAIVRVSCSEATCRGTVELTSQVLDRDHGRLNSSRHRQTIVLARGTFRLAKGESARIVLHLTVAGRRRLAGARPRRLSARLMLSVEGGRAIVKSVTVS